MNTRSVGRKGEEMAAARLTEKGYRIISSNYQTRYGELDCIAQEPGGTLVFLEVKHAKTLSKGHPMTWVTKSKQRKIGKMAKQYLTDHGFVYKSCRFDVISITGNRIEHLKNAFMI